MHLTKNKMKFTFDVLKTKEKIRFYFKVLKTPSYCTVRLMWAHNGAINP